ARRLRTKLELEHKRRLRRERERDRIEERAARRAAAIDDAREATSDDAIVLDMTRSRKRFVAGALAASIVRSEEHTSELQSRFDLVCRLLLEKKKTSSNMRSA